MAPKDFNPDDILPGTGIGAYVVRRKLGEGGTSSVYEVESAGGDRFALKICRFHGDASSTSQRRVDQRHSRSLACLQLLKGQRNVAQLHAHGRHPHPLHGYQYLVQELVPDGLLITEWVKRESPPLRKLVGAFAELAGLCGVMASKGICHRDLKPGNILVTPDGTPKVIDFESATCPGAEPVTLRAASEEPGTGGWQCPEACYVIAKEPKGRGEKTSFHPWGDVLSTGIVFYECLTGEHPFDRPDGSLRVREKTATETPIHPARLNPAVPPGLNKVAMRLLEMRPGARYRDGAEAAMDLRKLLKKARGRRWTEPFKQPVADGLLLVSPFVFPEESERPMPDMPGTPSSVPQNVDTGPSAKAERDHEASPRPAKSDASPRPADADTDKAVLFPKEWDTSEPRELPESEPAVGTVLDLGKAGAYTLEELLGRGGYGEVYRARQEGAAGFVQQVAIKRLRPDSQPAQVRHFVDEARVLSRLHHENIAHVHAFHEWKGSYYLVMEYIDGLSLHALLELARRKGHCFSEPVACAVMADVAEALDCAHQARGEADKPLRIVHRDVSPTNILIAKTGRVVLVDFGVARFEDEGRTPTGSGSNPFKGFKGKVPYLSPEQVKGGPLDARSDLFSVGTILVEMLTGVAPFGTTSHFTTWKRIENVTSELVASLLPGVSKPLRALCQKLLAHDPDQRFATAREAAMALRRHMRPHEGPESIRAEVEKLQGLPDAETPPAPAPAKATAVRALSQVKRARRTLAAASVFVFATLAFVSWYVPHHAVPEISSPSLQGPSVASSHPPAKTIAPVPPAHPPPSPLVDEPKRENGAAVAAGPSDLAPGKHSAPAVVLADKEARIPLIVTSPPADRQTDQASSLGFDKATGARRYDLVAAENQREGSVDQESPQAVQPELPLARQPAQALKAENQVLTVEAEAASVNHALAMLLASGREELTPFVIRDETVLEDNGVLLKLRTYMPRNPKVALGKTAVVFSLVNRDKRQPWDLDRVRLMAASTMESRPFALQASSASVGPRQTGRFAVVMDMSAFENGAERLVLELWRSGKSGPSRQTTVELVAVGVPLRPEKGRQHTR